MSPEPRRTLWNDYGFEPNESYEDDSISPTRSRFLARLVNSDALPRPYMHRLRLAVAKAHGIAARMSPEDADLLALATVYLTSAPFPIIGVRADATHYSPDYEPLPEGVLYVGGNPFFVDRRTTEVSSLVSYDCAMKRSEMLPTEPLPQANNRWNDIRFQLGADDEPVTHSMDDPRHT